MLRRSVLFLAACSHCLASCKGPTEGNVTTSGSFNILSINVDGIPYNLGLKQNHTMDISRLLSKYNYGVINVQEDFDFNPALYKYDTHPFRTVTSGGYPRGSGLNTLSKYDWVDFTRPSHCGPLAHLVACKMKQRYFTFMRVRIAQGVYIDMINLDCYPRNEGTTRSFIRRIADFITANSAGNAVIVFGNPDELYTDAKDNIRIFGTQNNLTDAWVQGIGGKEPTLGTKSIMCPKDIPRNISCETIDKVLYRGSSFINLTSTGFHYDTDRFLSPNRTLLANFPHHPVRVEFNYTLAPGVLQSEFYGGKHGSWFNDMDLVLREAKPRLSSITLRGAERLDGITLKLTSGQIFQHGGPGGDPYTLQLDGGEYVSFVEFCWGKKHRHTRNFYARATTNHNRSIQAGKRTSDCRNATAPEGYGAVGALGREGDEMDQIALIFVKQ